METFKIIAVVTITLAIVILINVWIYYRFSKPNDRGGTIKMVQKAAKRGTSPWAEEDKKLQELDALIKGLNKDHQEHE